MVPRSPFQSDFVVPEHEAPVADETKEASARSTKWVYVLMFVVLAALVIICAVGPHIPAGE
jgi:hypothetical protein